ncbi:beta-glucosidase [Mucilaginibacter sp. UYP25]|uniref:glycoside hydrolase family 3 C-terminal domain-containing protein n=1 Tax=unclassified Mucilaginibacter TaxID=2617802 RepID=UPI003391D0EF
MSTIHLRKALLCAFVLYGVSAQAQKAPQLGKSPIQQIIKAMTLEEKAKLVVGNGFSMPGAGPTIGQTQDKVPGAAGTTYAIPRLGIPSIVVSDGPAGVRIDSVRKGNPGKTYYATAWPVGTLLASSWDTALVRKVGAAFGHEVKEYGIDVLLGPALNIHRNPLGGRNFEYFSEDPLVAGTMAAAMVNGIESNGVGTSIKHFAVNNQETNRNTVNAIVSERALREIYLKGFEIAVERSQPWTVMSSYNLLNGTYTSESHDLLSTILRKEWGFKGSVMTDWFGGKNAVAQMNAGNDLLMPGGKAQTQAIMDAVKSGKLSVAVLDKNVSRLLSLVLMSPTFKGYKHSDKPDLKKDAFIARAAAAESMVLLKNDAQSLPLKAATHNVALYGINGYELIAGGTGSGDVNKAYKISLEQGLAKAGYAVDKDIETVYTAYLTDYAKKNPKKGFFQEFMNPTPAAPEYAMDKDMMTKKAATSDVAILAIGRNAGEGRDRKTENDYELSGVEKDMIKDLTEVYHAQHKKVIVVLNIGGVIDIQPVKKYADAILLAWQPGLEGGNASTDVLSGKVNPSGKLATTFPANYKDEPTAKNFPGKEFPEKATTGMMGMKAIPAEVTYEEGIYVGYRYYNTFKKATAYEFGYGLSYTGFAYSNLSLSNPTFTGKITVSVKVTNTGKVAGKEVAQLYLNAPAKSMDKPAEELKGFAKTALLQPGASQVLMFSINAKDLASFNTKQSAWVAEAGTYNVKIGASSDDIKLQKIFKLAKDITVQKVNKALVPQIAIDELKN